MTSTTRLLDPPEEIIQKMIVDYGLAVLAGEEASDGSEWPITAGPMPDTEEGVQDDSISIRGTAGRVQGKTQIDGEVAEVFGIQIMVRSGGAVAGYRKIKSISDTFDRSVRRVEVELNGSVYLVHEVSRTTTVIALGHEAGSRRRLWTVNAVATITIESGS